MYISRVKLKNWRNFVEVDVPLRRRQFLVGPNASGKSNCLDVFRFLRDIAKPDGGGLQRAVNKRGGLSKIRCLNAHSKRASEVFIGIEISPNDSESIMDRPEWIYEVGIKQSRSGSVFISSERVEKNDRPLLERPDSLDEGDKERLQQTHLEQVNNNKDFREISDFLGKISYMHLVPQLLRHFDEIQGNIMEDDPFGQGLLYRLQQANKKSRDARLRKISGVIKVAVPNLEEIRFEQDPLGKYHITGSDNNWRPRNAKQYEDQLSDGTLRLIGLLWSLLENNSVLLLEEPELSLHSSVVGNLAGLFHKAQKGKNPRRQLFISTHSAELLSDSGIDGGEILVLQPSLISGKGTTITPSVDIKGIKALLKIGEPAGPIVIRRTAPENHRQTSFSL
ncbi:AAA family ATPase [Thioalkalivibrio sp. HK1]|uniref:AAA family ATPase n=1 Tax=Thioalkalivibrio sp. HK1 TaxID=1469245 RepID=UPI000470FED3|nr:AAA family ATPase [Thioalkalivibrio sp. HK1]